jgi:hypothetical protein
MINKNQIFLYILYLCLAILLTISYEVADHYAQLFLASNYYYHIPLFLVKEITAISFGVLLGLDYILKETKMEGQWRLNIPRLFILALPCLIFFSIRLLAISGAVSSYPMLFGILEFIFLTSLFFQILFGYIVITSITKTKV